MTMELLEAVKRLERRQRLPVQPKTLEDQTLRIRSLVDRLAATGDRITIKHNKKHGDPVIEARIKTGLLSLRPKLQVSFPTGIVVRGRMHNPVHPIEITVTEPAYAPRATLLAAELKGMAQYRDVQIYKDY